jgi:hypothetical protein
MQPVNPATTPNRHNGPMAADYYSILARAVSRMPTNNAQARQELYQHARTILLTQLGRQEISELGAVGERVILETAIFKVEAEAQSQGEIAPEAFGDSVPLHDADDKLENSVNAVDELRAINAPRPENGISELAPDFASRLREPARKPCQRHDVFDGDYIRSR